MNQNIIIGLYLLVPLLGGSVVFLLTRRAADKIYQLSKSPDELETLVKLKAKTHMASYWFCAFMMMYVVLIEQWIVSKNAISAMVSLFLFFGVFYERFLLKKIMRKFSNP